MTRQPTQRKKVERPLDVFVGFNGLGAPRLLVLNPNDGSVWGGFENRILHLDAAGAMQHQLSVRARDLAVAQDGSMWILTDSAL